MKRRILFCALVSALLALTACAASPQQENGGWVGMLPYTSTESGVRGLQPMEGWSDRAQLVQGSAAVPMDGVIAELLKQTSLQELPEPTGTYRGHAITWDLFTFESHVPDVEPLVRLKLALAEAESSSYWVLLVVVPEAYEANPRLYDTVFRHAVYALQPLE